MITYFMIVEERKEKKEKNLNCDKGRSLFFLKKQLNKRTYILFKNNNFSAN
jgi:hypothetical protein